MDGSLGRRVTLTVLLSAVAVLTRVPLASRYLFDWDAVGFALALDHYDVSLYQPHPPGYLLLVGCAKAIRAVLSDPNRSLVTLSILATALALVLTWALGRRLRDDGVGVAAALLLASNPIFWFYGEVAGAYAIDAAASVAVAYACYRAVSDAEASPWAASLVFAIAVGFRQSLGALLLPVYLWALLGNRRPWGRKLLPAAVAALLTILWTLVMAHASGGYEAYREVTRSLLSTMLGRTSLVFGASLADALRNLAGFAIWTAMAGGLIALPAFRGVRWQPGGRGRWFGEKAFLAVWLLPPMLFYAVVHMIKAGYALTYAPGLSLVAALWIGDSSATRRGARRRSAGLVALAVVLQAAFFLGAGPVRPETIASAARTARLPEVHRLDYLVNNLLLRFSARGISLFDEDTACLLEQIRRTPAPLAVVGTGDWARIIAYYRPDLDVIFFPDLPPSRVSLFPGHRGVRLVAPNEALLPRRTRLVWISPSRSDLPGPARRATPGCTPFAPAVEIFGPAAPPLRNHEVLLRWE